MAITRKVRAYHKAGHAVVARVLGVDVMYVAMFSTDAKNGADVRTRCAGGTTAPTPPPPRV